MRTGVKTELEHWETSGKIYPGGVSIEPPGRILTDRRIVWMPEALNIQKCSSKVCKCESESCNTFYGTRDSLYVNMNESWGPCVPT
jgi:hypothetical protein